MRCRRGALGSSITATTRVAAAMLAAVMALLAGAAGPAQADVVVDDHNGEMLGKAGGLVYLVSSSDSVGTGEARGAAATCPGRRKPTGGGAAVQGTSGTPFATSALLPGSRGRSWVATFLNGAGSPTAVRSYLVCGRLSDRVVRTKTLPDAAPGIELKLKVRCPAGSKVTGGGVQYADPDSRSRVLAPFDGPDDDARPDDGFRVVGYQDVQGDVKVTALCATGRYAYRTQTQGPFGSETLAGAQAACREDEHATGGGGMVGGTTPTARIVHTYPTDGLDPGSVADDLWETNAIVPLGATVSSIAICKR